MLATNTTLESLELNSNVIDLEGITALADSLTKNDCLRVLRRILDLSQLQYQRRAGHTLSCGYQRLGMPEQMP